jgi:hypothetical protein
MDHTVLAYFFVPMLVHPRLNMYLYATFKSKNFSFFWATISLPAVWFSRLLILRFAHFLQ